MNLKLLPLLFLFGWFGTTSPVSLLKLESITSNQSPSSVSVVNDCDLLDLSVSFDEQFPLEQCCWTINLINDGKIEYAVGIMLDNLNGAELASVSANGGWTTQNVTATSALIFPDGPFIQPGFYPQQIDFCLTNRTALPQSLDISWLAQGPVGELIPVCTEPFFADCPLSPPPACELDCPNNTYNLVFNGDFEAGDVGFTSDLPQSCTCLDGTYCVTTNAKLKCNNSMWDPVLAPGSSGNYLVVDGDFGANVWRQNVQVNSGTGYRFSFDFYPDISGDPSPTLEVYLNGSLILGGIVGTLHSWTNFCTDWTANFTGTATLEIRQQNSAGYDDYGIDNIRFEACCDLAVTLPDTITVCENEPVQFHPVVSDAVGPLTYSWAPATGLSATNIEDPIATPGMNTTYTLTVSDSLGCTATASVAVNYVPCPCNDLIFNGSFEEGDTGFTTALNPNCSCQSGTYCIAPNARDKCTNSQWKSVFAPSGIGNFLVVDGFSGTGTIWEQVVSVTAGDVYEFCFDYYPDISSGGTPQLLVEIDDGSGPVALGTTSGIPNNWQKYCFNTGGLSLSTGPATLRIVQANSVVFNDYGIDNIQFGTCCELEVDLPDTIQVCIIDDLITPVQFHPDVTGAIGPVTYSWTPTTGLSATNVEDPTAFPGVNTTYTVTVTDSLGCMATDSVFLEYVICPCNNQVENGDFESGNTAFTSGLSLNCTCQSGTYCIAPNARDKCTNSQWKSIYPPTGTGNLLVVDGFSGTGTVWEQTVSLVPGFTYDFCFDYYPDISSGGTPQLRVEIDYGSGPVTLGTTTGTAGSWTKACFFGWTAPPGVTSAMLRIVQVNSVVFNDYGIDNIQFGSCCSSANLLENPGFEAGNTGFISSLPFNCTCQGASYCVAPNARDKCTNSLWESITAPDGSSNFLIVDGTFSTINFIVWQQDVNVSLGELYDFCFDFYPDLSGGGVVELAAEIFDGTTTHQLGTTAGCAADAWCQVCFNDWPATVNGVVTIRLLQNNDPQYADFGIDNVEFGGCLTTTDISEVRLPQIFPLEVYPNPFTQELTVSLQSLPLQDIKLTVSDLWGRELTRQVVSGGSTHTLAVGQLPAGVYLVAATDRDGRIWRSRVVKQ